MYTYILHITIRCTSINRCLDYHYPLTQLPSATVIIIFHNEAYTVLLRTVTSILNRTPPGVLREGILVDDFSDHGKTIMHIAVYMYVVHIWQIVNLYVYTCICFVVIYDKWIPIICTVHLHTHDCIMNLLYNES